MKKKNGFISTSVIYSFFLVFLMLLLLMVSNLISNRLMLNKIKEAVFEDLTSSSFARYLVYHADTLGLEEENDEYIYVGTSVDNFVCLSTSCSDDDLYRVIGVIDGKVKLIKYTSIDDVAYDDSTNVFYETSMYTYLNNSYLSSISNYDNLISDTTWYIGGIYSSYLTGSSSEIYEQEVGLLKQSLNINAKVGLPYISDYLYAGGWMLNGDMWFITKVITDDTTTYSYAFYVDDSGNLGVDTVSNKHGTYPVFFLNKSISYLSGTGTKSNPFIVG